MIPPEEQARANLYGLLARLFYGPPDLELLRAMASERLAGDLGLTWQQLASAAALADPEAVREEYETAFIGTGKAPVTLYTTTYSIRYSNETPLADLRGELAGLSLGRRADVYEPEDHIAALCDTMRHLVAEQKAGLEEQRRFFNKWIHPTGGPLCAAIECSDKTSFYKPVARFAASFFDMEQSAFEML
jgi:TorA maturation chaperone TorD